MRKLIHIVIILIGFKTSAFAKTSPYRIDLTSPQFWSDHDSYLATVLQTNGEESFTCNIIESFQPAGTNGQIVTLSSSNCEFYASSSPRPEYEVGSTPWPKKDGMVAIFIPKEPLSFWRENRPLKIRNETLVQQVSSTADPLVKAMENIAAIRKNPDLQVLFQNALNADDLVSKYWLKQLLAQPTSPDETNYIAGLKAIQSDQTRKADIRMLACQAALKISGQADYSETEYSWLQTAVAKSTNTNWTAIKPFVDRLVAFTDRRRKSTVFLLEVVNDSRQPTSTRIAANSGLSALSIYADVRQVEIIFSAGLSLLKDKSPTIRQNGAFLLAEVCENLKGNTRKEYLDRAIIALQMACNAEIDNTTRFTMKNNLDYIQGLAP